VTHTERDSGVGRGGRTGRGGRGGRGGRERAQLDPVGLAPGQPPRAHTVANAAVQASAELDLPSVLHAAPAAVVLVDLTEQTVIYANAAANAMTGGLALPADADEWGEAAGLTDPGGVQLKDTAAPLSRLATGVPVSGEPVAVRDHDRPGALMWASGLPLTPTPSEAGRSLALVVLMPLSGDGSSPVVRDRYLERVRDRAVIATDLPFAISDPLADDNPLVWVNPSFTRLTGYTAEEAVGRNCRFLQGPNTDPRSVERIADALAERRPVTEVLLNYRKDGTAFWNQVSISPVYDGSGTLVNFVGVQADLTERVLVEHERQAALTAAEEARNDLRLLTEATTALASTLDVTDAARRLADLVVPALADFCFVDLLDEPSAGAARRAACAHRDEAEIESLFEHAERLRPRVGGSDAISYVLSGGPPALITDVAERPNLLSDDGDVGELSGELRAHSAVVVPLRARGNVLGALTLCTERPFGRRYTRRDLELAADLAVRAGMAVDNARLYVLEHTAAETLQRSLLPELPTVAGLRLAARYLVGTGEAQVGGDWYDVLPLPDGAIGIAVGDVVGHDLRAAAAMGQLRGLLRSYAWEGLPPGRVLDRCDQLVQGLDMAAMATAIYARLESTAKKGRTRLLRYSNAGHPPPVLREPSGTTRFLDRERSALIGAVPPAGRVDAADECAPGSLLLLYTDGIIEVRGDDAEHRQRRLIDVVSSVADPADVEAVCDLVLDELVPATLQDDVALLAIHLDG
jgi:PAS domain S-box-containing protein